MKTTKLSTAPASRSHMSGSDLSHILYVHRRRARELDVSCPRCGSVAQASKTSETDLGDLVAESVSWHLDDWSVVCGSCPARQCGLAFGGLPPLYWQVDASSEVVWAWNRDHLQMLAGLLSGEPIDESPYAPLKTYVPKRWLSRRRALAKVIRRRLSE